MIDIWTSRRARVSYSAKPTAVNFTIETYVASNLAELETSSTDEEGE